MRKQLMLLVVPLCVVAIAAGVATAAPDDSLHSQGPKLDKLHAVRPTAAFGNIERNQLAFLSGVSQTVDALNRLDAYLQAVQQAQLQQWFDALAQNAAAQAAANRPAPSSWVGSSSNPGGFLACVRNRESGGNYAVHNSGGSGAAGAYQFLPSTWNSIAASSGRPDLVGVDPASASPADQDAMAQALYAQQGAAPWGGGC